MLLFRTVRNCCLALMFLSWSAEWSNGAVASVSREFGVTALTPSNVAEFASALIPSALETSRIPGAAFAVVRDGEVLCEEGFGLADVAAARPVSEDRTLFRVASISKIFTAAAVLELAEDGQLDLHKDINAYLEQIEIEPVYGEPVTLHHLLTHTSGFDLRRLRSGARAPENRLTLKNYLARFQPGRIRPPGLFSSYDNYGYALAGYIVQRTVGERFFDYIEESELRPLGMTNSTFVASERPNSQFAKGYRLEGDELRALPKDFVNIVPSAGLCATARDMSRFLIALTANLMPDGSRAFSPPVREGLLKPQFAFHPDVPGRCYGFNQIFLNGRRVLMQTGLWPGFTSTLLFFPKTKVGVFLAYNRNDRQRLIRRASRTFARRFIPKGPASETNDRQFFAGVADSSEYEGAYLSLRFPERAPFLGFPQEQKVESTGDGRIEIDGLPYREIATRVFERTENPAMDSATAGRRVAFRLSEEGTVSHLVTEKGTFRRASQFETAKAQKNLTIVAFLVLVSGVVWWPLSGSLRLLKTMRFPPESPPAKTDRVDSPLSLASQGLAFITGGLALWTLVLRLSMLFQYDRFPYLYGLPSPARNLMWIGPILLVLTLGTAGIGFVAWRRRFWGLAGRLHFTLVAAALLLVCLDLQHRNLLF